MLGSQIFFFIKKIHLCLRPLQRTFSRLQGSLQLNRELFKHEIYSFLLFFRGGGGGQFLDPDRIQSGSLTLGGGLLEISEKAYHLSSFFCSQFLLTELQTLVQEEIQNFPVSSANYAQVFRKALHVK